MKNLVGQTSRWPWLEIKTPNDSLNNKKFLWPKVTIVTPSFNQGRYLEETIRSVLLQGYPNLEYLIIDGGSTDNSIEIIRKYEPWLAFWISEPDNGQADAINKGFIKSTGAYLGWLNSDDILYPSAIFRVVEAFRLKPDADMIYGDIEQGESLEREVRPLKGEQIEFSEMLKTLRVPIPQQGSLWRRTVIESVGLLDYRWNVVLDREFYTRVAEKFHVHYLPGPLGFFRNHELSKSISQGEDWLSELPQMYKEYFERKDLPHKLRLLYCETMGSMYMTCAVIAFRSGETLRAAVFLALAQKVDLLLLFRKQRFSKVVRYLKSKMSSSS